MNALERLCASLEQLGPVAVAVSGGVDSMTLAYVAHQVNNASQVFHALSPAVPVQATERVQRYAEANGWNLQLIDAGEIKDPEYLANPANRCYFCKTKLYDAVVFHTHLTVVSGTNTDDLGDYRPGLIAAKEHAVRHPYVEVDINKDTLRGIASELGLEDLKDLPAAPCLSSRVTTGIEIEPALLPLINDVEVELWRNLLGRAKIAGIRCRIRPDSMVAIEIESTDDITSDAELTGEIRQVVSSVFNAGGFAHLAAEISIEPYQRGSAFLINTLALDN